MTPAEPRKIAKRRTDSKLATSSSIIRVTKIQDSVAVNVAPLEFKKSFKES